MVEFPSELFTQLRTGSVDDYLFDRIFPKSIRKLSRVHWTPVSMAREAARLLALDADARILDVGSGAGKFSLVGAAATSASFTGIEQRANLVKTAHNIAAQLNWPRVEFLHGNALDLDWSAFTGIYLFNPFAEHLHKSIRMDKQIVFGPDAYQRAVERTVEKLGQLRKGGRVVTLNSFGGDLSHGFKLEHEKMHGNATLRLWLK